MIRVVGQTLAAVASGHRQPSIVPDGPVGVGHRQSDDDRFARLERGTGQPDKVWSSARSRPWSCASDPVAGRTRLHRRHVEDRGRSRPAAFQWSTAVARRRARRPGRWPPPACGTRATASSSRTSSAMYSKKLTTNSGRPLKRGPQLRVLGGDPDRARVEVAHPHHHAAAHDQRRGGEAELLGAEQRGDHHVAAGLELPSTCTTMRSRSSLSSSVCWVSARPAPTARPRA